jgi:hypothetical protein
MIGTQRQSSVSSASVSVETPTCLFPIFDYFADVVVMPNRHTFPFFHFNSPVTCIRKRLLFLFSEEREQQKIISVNQPTLFG